MAPLLGYAVLGTVLYWIGQLLKDCANSDFFSFFFFFYLGAFVRLYHLGLTGRTIFSGGLSQNLASIGLFATGFTVIGYGVRGGAAKFQEKKRRSLEAQVA
ncbi:hypothetical protein V1514DRAFT_327877 [Lipomyces japonicus]|uniref:uncharacterized protein n=1 Tax=Lipomyces japonicus TaxID=56871 RepID=UPI0034CF5A37